VKPAAVLESGAIDPPIGATYALEELGRALRDIGDRRTLGKSVVLPR
jgi:NADPH2:quinone reductase